MSAELDALAAGVRAGRRASLARAITLVESRRDDHQVQAGMLLEMLLPWTGQAARVGITGVPGVGKSTFLERLGMDLIRAGRRVAVLAVDPSSQRSGGSILGDKTRMSELAADDRAYVRPSPSGGSLGGVHRKTREAMLLCEAAGYDVVLVETVGVGQSETAVASMVDTFCVLMLPGAGDELQGIKRGILELADVLVVHKADGERLGLARSAARDLHAALRLFGARDAGWQPPVLLASSVLDAETAGIDAVWRAILDHSATLRAAGRFDPRRADQQVQWLWSMVDEVAVHRVRAAPEVRAVANELDTAVRAGRLPASVAARRVLAIATGQ